LAINNGFVLSKRHVLGNAYGRLMSLVWLIEPLIELVLWKPLLDFGFATQLQIPLQAVRMG
jgi:hypothetical protein